MVTVANNSAVVTVKFQYQQVKLMGNHPVRIQYASNKFQYQQVKLMADAHIGVEPGAQLHFNTNRSN